MLDDDLFIRSEDEKIALGFESKKAKDNFIDQMVQMNDKSELIKSEGYLCGDCAAYPCFRGHGEESPAGLCYQEVRLCRQECNYFIQNRDSGKSPYFIIIGNCKKDNSFVYYNSECRFLNKENKK